MSLRNALIDPHALPAAEPLRLTPVAASYRWYRLTTLTMRWLFALLVVGVLLSDEEVAGAAPALAFWLPTLLLLAVLHEVHAWREAKARAWGLRQGELLYASGLLQRRLTVLPCNRIQHVATASGPLERRFDLLRVICYTAGGLSADLVLQGLCSADAERVRQHLLGQLHAESEPLPTTACSDPAQP